MTIGKPIPRAIGFDVAYQMKQMYEERNAAGGRLWSMNAIARRFSASESSTRRAILGEGSYKHVPEAITPEELDRKASESAARMAAMMNAEGGLNADVMLGRLDLPVSEEAAGRARQLITGGDAGVDTEELKERLDQMEAEAGYSDGAEAHSAIDNVGRGV